MDAIKANAFANLYHREPGTRRANAAVARGRQLSEHGWVHPQPSGIPVATHHLGPGQVTAALRHFLALDDVPQKKWLSRHMFIMHYDR